MSELSKSVTFKLNDNGSNNHQSRTQIPPFQQTLQVIACQLIPQISVAIFKRRTVLSLSVYHQKIEFFSKVFCSNHHHILRSILAVLNLDKTSGRLQAGSRRHLRCVALLIRQALARRWHLVPVCNHTQWRC